MAKANAYFMVSKTKSPWGQLSEIGDPHNIEHIQIAIL